MDARTILNDINLRWVWIVPQGTEYIIDNF